MQEEFCFVSGWLQAAAILTWVILLGYVFAKVEIQIEGPDGWAAKLPTWRIDKHRLLDIFWGGRPMTGYHFWAFLFMALVFHLSVFLAGILSLRMEMRILGALMLFWIIEDFLWFVLNPAFGLRRFNPQSVPWHKQWFGPAPRDYVTYSVGGLALLASSFVGRI